TCLLVGMLAFYWQPDESRKLKSAIAAFALAAICPFTVIYVGTILTETWACFFVVSLALLTTVALKSSTRRQTLIRWIAVGLLGGLQVFFRPDSGLFVLAVGLTLVSTLLTRTVSWPKRFAQVMSAGVILSIAFLLVLVPWTIRNWQVFHLFQPLAPAHAEMPGEFVPRGYQAWLRTWIDDGRYVETVLWPLDDKKIDIDEMPESAFDSEEQKERVEYLLDQYNNPVDPDAETPAPSPTPDPNASPTPESQASPSTSESEAAGEPDEEQPEEAVEPDEPLTPEMTPALDAEFAKIAQERIAKSRLRYYLWLPMKRAWALWVGSHSDYYPFSGELFPLDDIDYSIHQQIWLPLFSVMVFIYSLLGVAGGWVLWRARLVNSRRWLLLVTLLIFIRLAFFSTLENPEARYTVEFFPFLAVLGGIALAGLTRKTILQKKKTISV
ncbi:MAG TPA: hypothetical protein VGN86_17565, partial [Pyrinomonadaceae bacterium]|nr:hypothetical protein [Pyrinomonadaceae bacterium]